LHFTAVTYCFRGYLYAFALATVRHRGKKPKNCGNRETTLSMTFKLIEVAQNRWRRLKGYKLLADVLQGVNFKNDSVKFVL